VNTAIKNTGLTKETEKKAALQGGKIKNVLFII